MFTGLVETLGLLRTRIGRPKGARATIETTLRSLSLGESVSVNGVCLTVDRVTERGFEADMSSETLDRTTLGALDVPAEVHLERATPVGGRMGGHMVLGHVDGVARVAESVRVGDALKLTVRAPGELRRFLAPKGSIAVAGVSLTLNGVSDEGAEVVFDVMLVPHTLSRTTLGRLTPGMRVNIEVDVLARYVARQLSVPDLSPPTPDADPSHNDPDERILAKLRQGGYT